MTMFQHNRRDAVLPAAVTPEDLAEFMAHIAEAYVRSLAHIDASLMMEKCANEITEETARATSPCVKAMLEITSEKMMAAEPYR